MTQKYVPTKWVANETIGTANVMNNIEQGIVRAYDEIERVNSQLAQKVNKNDVTINIKDFGAKGDGVTDDTQAFKEANDYLYNYKIITDSYKQYTGVEIRTLYIPQGVYCVKGSDILGKTNRNTNNNTEIIYRIKGEGTIIWDVESENDVLFTLNYTIQKIDVSDISIVVVNNNNSIDIGGVVFNFIEDNDYNGNSRCKSSRSLIYNSTIMGGYNTSRKEHRIKTIFNIGGSTMNDQGLVLHCRFDRFLTVFKNTNPECVNWSFNHCAFYSKSNNSLYFDLGTMYSDFYVTECSFSFSQQYETLVKNRRNNASNSYKYQFTFRNNRYENQYKNSDGCLYLTDVDYGIINFVDSNFALSTSANPVIIQSKGNACVKIDNGFFNKLYLYTSLANNSFSNDAIILRDVECATYNVNVIDGSNNVLGVNSCLNRDIRPIVFNNFTDGGLVNCSYALSNTLKSSSVKRMKRKYSYTLHLNNSTQSFYLPRFVNITKIVAKNLKPLDKQYRYLSYTIGGASPYAKTSSGYIHGQAYQNNTDSVIFDGNMAVLSSTSKDYHMIKFEFKNDSGDLYSGSVFGEIEIYYEELTSDIHSSTPTSENIYLTKFNERLFGGSSNYRPPGGYTGFCYYDTTIKKAIFWDGSKWVDSQGAIV